MTVADILKTKGPVVHTVEAHRPLSAAADLLRRHKIGALVATSAGRGARGAPSGVLSERDIVLAIAAHGCDALDKPVSDCMTVDVHTCHPLDGIEEVLAQMTDRRVRHVPVVQDGALVGLVSIGDLVKQRIADAEAEAAHLKEYISTG